MPTLSIDGDQHSFTAGETLFEVAERIGKRVPSLCYDPRL